MSSERQTFPKDEFDGPSCIIRQLSTFYRLIQCRHIESYTSGQDKSQHFASPQVCLHVSDIISWHSYQHPRSIALP